MPQTRQLVVLVLAVLSLLVVPTIAHKEGDPTHHLALKLRPGVNPLHFAEKHNLHYEGELVMPHFYHFSHKYFEKNPHLAFKNLSSFPDIHEVHPQFSKARVSRSSKSSSNHPQDPLYKNQWHLHGNPTVDINVEAAWNRGYKGTNSIISIIDDGLDHRHPDIEPNYLPELSFDFNYNKSDPLPRPESPHGTEAAATAAGVANSVCGVGVAPLAKVAGIRMLADETTDVQEARAIAYKADKSHIYSCSWGPVDDGQRLDGPGHLAALAIEWSILNGRDGKGIIYVWASGNGKRFGDNCNYDGYANHRYTLTVASHDFEGKSPYYSEACSVVIASLPSSGYPNHGITTSGNLDEKTLTPTCTDSFGGTSASCPIAAGVVALALEARKDLTWRDMQGIFIHAAKPINPSDSDWSPTNNGLRHNHKYGFGRIDVDAVINTALSWSLLPPYVRFVSQEVERLIPTSSLEEEIVLVVPNTAKTRFIVEHVELLVVATVLNRGRVTIKLISPHGVSSTLQEIHNDMNSDIEWIYRSIRHWGEEAVGNWRAVFLTPKPYSPVLQKKITCQLALYGHFSN